MNAKTGFKALAAFVGWMGVALLAGYLQRDAIGRLLGPEVWVGAALWAGSLLGLMNVLGILITARR